MDFELQGQEIHVGKRSVALAHRTPRGTVRNALDCGYHPKPCKSETPILNGSFPKC